jgi:hypothetical protein
MIGDAADIREHLGIGDPPVITWSIPLLNLDHFRLLRVVSLS